MRERYLLLVDLGGVLLHHDPSRAWTRWAAAAGLDAEALRQRWMADTTGYTAFERGELTQASFLQQLRVQLGVTLDDEQLSAGWNSVFPAADNALVAVLAGLDPAVFRPVGLSNTNLLHERQWRTQFRSELAALHTVYCSHQIGAAKPDPETFGYVAAHEQVPYHRMILLDDQPANTAAAARLGLHAHRYRNAADAAAYLTTFTARTDGGAPCTS